LSALARRQLGFLVAFAWLMLATPLAAQVKPGGVVAPQKSSPRQLVATQHRARPFEVKILRDGKASESVWFADEEASNNKDARNLPTHHRATSDGAAADAGASSTVASAPESVPDSREMVAAPLNTSVAPASAPASGFFNAPADHRPTSNYHCRSVSQRGEGKVKNDPGSR
jgi:hypothetical protein